MTPEQQTFVTTMAQVLPTVLIAVGVYALQDVVTGKRHRHTRKQSRRWGCQAWLLYLILPLTSEAGLLGALYLAALSLDATGLLTWVMPLSLVTVVILILSLFGNTANLFVGQSDAPTDDEGEAQNVKTAPAQLGESRTGAEGTARVENRMPYRGELDDEAAG